MAKAVIILLFFIYSCVLVFAYHRGIITGVRITKTGSAEKIKVVKASPTMEETIAMNIENYRGDGKGQVEFEDI